MDKAELEGLYLKQGKSVHEIAKLKGKHFATIYYWLKKHRIPTNPNRIKEGKHYSPETEFKLGLIPWNKGLTKNDDTRLATCSEQMSHRRLGQELSPMHKTKIGRSLKGGTHKDAQYSFGKEFYEHLYWNQGLSLQAIADRLNCNMSTACYYLKRYQIPRRQAFEAQRRKPTAPELRLKALIERHDLPYRYVGNGAVWFEGYNPDFINIDGAKGIIELFGDYWHTTKIKKWRETEGGRIYHFAKFGFKTLVIWENELGDEEAVVKKIKKFTKRAGVL